MDADAALQPSPESLRETLRVVMTTTSPACPVGDMIADEVAATLRAALPAGTPVDVTLTWSPAWDSSMTSDVARRHFNW